MLKKKGKSEIYDYIINTCEDPLKINIEHIISIIKNKKGAKVI